METPKETETPMQKAKLLVMGTLCTLGLFASIANYAESDMQRQRAERETYCSNVVIWRAGKVAGIPESKRRGHADDISVFDKWCNNSTTGEMQ